MQPPSGIQSIYLQSQDATPIILSHDIIYTATSTISNLATAAIASVMASSTTTFSEEISSQASAAAKGGPATIYDQGSQGDCELLGSFALLVQAALGALALLSLVYKRWRERPQRPLKVWFFDVSKQVFGSVLVHIVNIFMSMLTSGRFSVQVEPSVASKLAVRTGDNYVPNPCSFYLLNLAIDTTVGIPILIVLLKITTGAARFTPFGKPYESIQSGNYGNPPKAWWWLKQSVIYFFGLFGMKLCVLIIFLLMPWISKVGDWALGWTEGNERLQIAFVMMIFPLIMNALQYYIIDSFIKKKVTDQDDNLGHERLPTEDPDRYDDGSDEEGGRLNRARRSSLTSDSDSDREVKKSKGPKGPHQKEEEYDPNVDGDAPTIIGSSSSALHGRGNVVRPELYPKE